MIGSGNAFKSPASRMLVRVWLSCLAMSMLCVPVLGDDQESAQKVADQLDFCMRTDWQAARVTPAPVADDGEFLRRIFLHLNGTIPDVTTVRRFLADDSPLKRSRQIDECLDGPAYCTHFAEVFKDVLLPDSGENFFVRQASRGFEIWLVRQLAEEARYDDVVRRIVVGSAETPETGGFGFSETVSVNQFNPSGFYLSRESVPESLAAASMRHFLGVRIECAQCHDHPFDDWKQEQFWGIAAFFSRQTLATGPGEVTFQIKIPNTDRTVRAAFLDDSPTGWKAGTNSRQAIADWMTSPTNRRFSEAIVNRVWGHLFGRGLVHPVDDFYDGNPASHPAVLSLLADEFVKHDFDLKFLLRAITCSQTYQLSSRRTDESQDAPEMFARMSAQGLTASQLRNSIIQAVGTRPDARLELTQNGRGVSFDEVSLVRLFPNNAGSSQERESSILQSLLLMNSPMMSQAVSPGQPGTLSAALDAPFLNTDQKIDTLFLATLTRFPEPSERERVHAFLKETPSQGFTLPFLKQPGPGAQNGYSGLLWALLNSSEFCLNH